jgi:Tfp pilus assembly protein PilV
MKRRAEDGFSLIEVVIALGLLAGVLISVAGLFILGGRSVKSGRSSSEALAAGKEIVEEMNGWAFAQLWGNFNLNGQAKTYTVDTNSCTTTDCIGWRDALRAKLGPTAHATIKIDSLTQSGTAPDFANASGTTLAKNVRLTVSVAWTQTMNRTRNVSVVTTRN